MTISLENAEFFIGIFSYKDTVHSYLVSGIVQDGKVIPLIIFGRKGNHKRAFLLNEPLASVNMYEAYSISFHQYQELLERVGYISQNQPTRYQLKLLSQKNFQKKKLTKLIEEEEIPYYSGEMYFSVDSKDQTKLHYKFVTHRKIPIKGTLELSQEFAKKDLNAHARRILNNEIESLRKYKCEIIEPFGEEEYPCESLSYQDFDAIKVDDLQTEKEKFYFSHKPDNTGKLHYKFRYKDYFLVGELYLEKEEVFSEDALHEYRKRVIAKESDLYFKAINNKNFQSEETFYFSHKPNNMRKLQYKFYYRDYFLAGELDLLQPFSPDNFDEYRARVMAKEGSLLSGYVASPEEELRFEILGNEGFHNEEDEELLAHIIAPISPLNNCRTATLEISELTLGFKPKTSGFFLKKPAYRISVEKKELDPKSFYILPKPPQPEDELSEEQRRILKRLHKRLRELPKIDPTSEITRQKFDILKEMYCRMAGESSASLDSLLRLFTENRKDSEILFTPRSFFSKTFSKQTSTESFFVDCESRLQKRIGS